MNTIRKIIKWANKPLPPGVCQAMYYEQGQACKVCWGCVIILTTFITIVLLLT